jgi:hypothetical protein
VRRAPHPVAVPTVVAAIALSWLGPGHPQPRRTDQPGAARPSDPGTDRGVAAAGRRLAVAGAAGRGLAAAGLGLPARHRRRAAQGPAPAAVAVPAAAVAAPLRHPRLVRGAAGAPAGHGHPLPPPAARREDDTPLTTARRPRLDGVTRRGGGWRQPPRRGTHRLRRWRPAGRPSSPDSETPAPRRQTSTGCHRRPARCETACKEALAGSMRQRSGIIVGAVCWCALAAEVSSTVRP